MVIRITKTTLDAIRAATRPGHTFKSTAVRRPDGDYEIDLPSDTVERLEIARLDGENLNDVIVRILALTGGRLQ